MQKNTKNVDKILSWTRYLGNVTHILGVTYNLGNRIPIVLTLSMTIWKNPCFVIDSHDLLQDYV